MIAGNFNPEKFTSGELCVIKKLWRELSEKSYFGNNIIGINYDVFETHIGFGGLLGMRLFDVLDSNSTGYIDLESFIEGLEIICLGSYEIQAKFLFKIFDIDNSLIVKKKHMYLLLNSIPRAYFSKDGKNYMNVNTNTNCVEWTNNHITDIAFEKIDIGHIEYLNQQEFDEWIMSNNDIINWIKSSIKYHLKYHLKIERTKKILTSKLDILPIPNLTSEPIRFESVMWKIGKKSGIKIKRYYLLYGSYLYYYSSKCNIIPSGVICIKDSIIEPEGQFGLKISYQDFDSNPNKIRHFICDTEEIRNEWINQFELVSNFKSFESLYELGENIGSGTFSSVYKCVRKKDKKEFAVKILFKSNLTNEDKQNLKNETYILNLVSHPNIIHLEEYFETSLSIYFVIELIKGGDLFDNIINKPMWNDEKLRIFAKTMSECLAYLHELGIVHQDIKPENILCENENYNKLILTDFGLSQMILPNKVLTDICGTLEYVAPEILSLCGSGTEADLWSLGIILYLVYYGKLPFSGEDKKQIINNIINENITLSPNKNLLANDLISKLLEKNPKKRISAKKILTHPFITSEFQL